MAEHRLPPQGAATMAPERLRALCYLSPEAEQALGREIGLAGGPDAPWGWLHVALVQARIGLPDELDESLARARQGFTAAGNAIGLAWCDEALAIILRRRGDFAGSAALQAEIDARPGLERDPLHRFVALHSRALTTATRGDLDLDLALRQRYAALEAALECRLPGPEINVLGALGGFHLDRFNLEDARRLNEEALQRAIDVGMTPTVTTAALNLIVIHFASGDMRQAHGMVGFIAANPQHVLPSLERRYAPYLALGHLAGGDVQAALELIENYDTEEFNDGNGLCMLAWVRARCLLAEGDAEGARRVGEAFLAAPREREAGDQPFDMMQLLDALANACERGGDHKAALEWQRQAHARYVQLVGRSARARQIALEVGHQLATTRRERDRAIQGHQAAESDRRRLAELNAALQAKIEETEQLHRRLQEQALRDPLTGLHNRRYLFETGTATLLLTQQRREVASVALFDLDHFKRLNDDCGHAAGDLALQRFADLLRRHLRGSDVVCRYGGEEFVAVMPSLGCGQAQAVLERIQSDMGHLCVPRSARRALGFSFSAGIAQFPQHGQTLDQLLARADKALYRAKRLGRSRTEQAAATTVGDSG